MIIVTVAIIGLLVWAGANRNTISPYQPTPTLAPESSTQPTPLTSDQMNMDDLSTQSQSATTLDSGFSTDINNLQTDTNGL